MRPHPSAPPQTLLKETAAGVRRAGEAFALRLFRSAAVRVPAYKDFLRRNSIAPDRIRTAADLQAVPPVDKKNYLTQYPLEKLCWDGTMAGKSFIYTATSGSTGSPFYFPRDASLDRRSMLMHELYLRTVSRGRVPSTLVIVSFGMGVWIGGVITYQAFKLLAERGYPVSIITPGTNKKEIFEALARLAPKYEQVVLCGYPPFLKDVLDEAPSHGFDPARRPLKLLFAAEAFSESFREYVMARAGAVEPCLDTANVYGSADLGTMAMETPVSIALRRLAVQDAALYAAIFPGTTKLPTLAQFHPAVARFDEQDGQLLVTGDNALPLIRYAIGDHGGVRGYDELLASAKAARPDLSKALRACGRWTLPLPFVYVYERADFSVKLYGAIIYAEHVRAGLQQPKLQGDVTGKFSMETKRDEREDEFLEVNVELRSKKSAAGGLRDRVRDAVVAALREKNAEYRYLSDNLKDRVLPRVALWPYEHPEHFRPGGKQQWIKKRK